MRTQVTKAVLVMGILLAAGSYAASKEWKNSDISLLRVAQMERADVDTVSYGTWPSDAVTVQPEQIFDN